MNLEWISTWSPSLFQLAGLALLVVLMLAIRGIINSLKSKGE